jgi:hypothetical protein
LSAEAASVRGASHITA